MRNGKRPNVVLMGGVVWIVALVLMLPHPFQTSYAHALLMLAPLVLVPLGMRWLPAEVPSSRWGTIVSSLQFPAALSLGGSFFLSQGSLAAILALPWLVTAGLLGWMGFMDILRYGLRSLSRFCIDMALIYMVVGAFWAVLDRLGFRPLGFEPVIVLLTAIHFHFAGFVLPLLTGLALEHVRGRSAAATGGFVIVSMPLVAAGITATQCGFSPWVESLAAWLMSAGGMLAAILQLRLVMKRPSKPLARVLWTMSAASLFFSMVLAALYGARFYLPLEWLSIPWMRALHGTANAIGFAGMGMGAWAMEKRDGSGWNAAWVPGNVVVTSAFSGSAGRRPAERE